MKQPRVKGKFSSHYVERRGDPIALRLPASLDEQIRELAGDDLKEWITQVLAREVERSRAGSAA
jgi:hypothetical protein